MTSKIQAIVSAFLAGLASFISWLAMVPPETQSGWLATLVELTPVQYRPQVGLWTRLAAFFLGIYATYRASHSGPQTPPTNPPSK